MTITRATQQSSAAPLTYTGAFSDSSAVAIAAQQIFAPASNVNGAYVEYIGFTATPSSAGGTVVSIIAKASAPANANDGDVVFKASSGNGASSTAVPLVPSNVQQAIRIKIPAGKGLYLNQTNLGGSGATDAQKTVLYTLL